MEITTSDNSVHEILMWSRNLVEPVLRKTISKFPLSIRSIAGYHFGWLDAQGQPSDFDGGKAIRSALTLLAAKAVGGEAHIAVPAAVTMELIHNFSLLHDDVMDGDLTRRHRATAWHVFGTNSAILTGDALLSAASTVLATSGHPKTAKAMELLDAAVLDLIDGQSADLEFENRQDVSLVECLHMANGKTASLLRCSCALGALLGGGSESQVTNLAIFGEKIGLAFQLVDDLLGIWGDPAITGKPIHSDVRNRKKSLPVVAALTQRTPVSRELAALYHQSRELSAAELARAVELIDLAGGRQWAVQTAKTELARGLAGLAAADLELNATAKLTQLAELITQRKH